jgi:hypothetical protein
VIQEKSTKGWREGENGTLFSPNRAQAEQTTLDLLHNFPEVIRSNAKGFSMKCEFVFYFKMVSILIGKSLSVEMRRKKYNG